VGINTSIAIRRDGLPIISHLGPDRGGSAAEREGERHRVDMAVERPVGGAEEPRREAGLVAPEVLGPPELDRDVGGLLGGEAAEQPLRGSWRRWCLFRPRTFGPRAVNRFIETFLRDTDLTSLARCVVIVEPSRVRVRRPPLRTDTAEWTEFPN
jgi:hypothetical protein